jgi:hypothetical protein
VGGQQGVRVEAGVGLRHLGPMQYWGLGGWGEGVGRGSGVQGARVRPAGGTQLHCNQEVLLKALLDAWECV